MCLIVQQQVYMCYLYSVLCVDVVCQRLHTVEVHQVTALCSKNRKHLEGEWRVNVDCVLVLQAR